MAKMTTRKELTERLRDVLAIEVMARNNYMKDTTLFKKQFLVEPIEHIKLDEDKHIALIDHLVKMLEAKGL